MCRESSSWRHRAITLSEVVAHNCRGAKGVNWRSLEESDQVLCVSWAYQLLEPCSITVVSEQKGLSDRSLEHHPYAWFNGLLHLVLVQHAH